MASDRKIASRVPVLDLNDVPGIGAFILKHLELA